MTRILVVGEDALCCALGERLVGNALPQWRLAGPSIDKKGVTKLLPELPRYVEQARYVQPVLCVADTDRKCVISLRSKWLPTEYPETFFLRFAVKEAESWLLADRVGFSSLLQVPLNKVPNNTDEIDDPKRLVLSLASRSKSRQFREEIVSATDATKQGAGYNLHLCTFARTGWDPHRARQNSSSLERALCALGRLGSSE